MPDIIIAADNGGPGHIYIGVQSPNGNYTFFGKYPENGSPGDDAIIKVDNNRYNELVNQNRNGFSETISVTDSQLNDLINFITTSAQSPGTYLLLGSNCADWVNSALITSGIETNGLSGLIQQNIITTSDLNSVSDNLHGVGDYINWAYSSGPNASNWIATSLTGYTPSIYDLIGGPAGVSIAIQDLKSGINNTGDFVKTNLDTLLSTISTHWGQAKLSQPPIVYHEPLVLDLNGDGVELISMANSHAYFDNDGDHFAEHTGWVSGQDGILARDTNGNGKIDATGETFGDDGGTTSWAKLAAMDTNSDGKVDSSDTGFSSLRIWQDENENGVTDGGTTSWAKLAAMDTNSDGKSQRRLAA